MRIVIEINDEIYKEILNGKDGWSNYAHGLIRVGIPLPEGHGRLIDADEFHRTLEDMPIRDTDKWFNWLQKACIRLAEAPTIIEADIESEE